jgi:cardiolipin synthase A/B
MGILAAAGSFAGELPAPGVYLNSEGSPLLPLLENARTSIDIEIYAMEDPTVRDLLRAALARGVSLRILKEPRPVGDKCKLFGFQPGEEDGSSDSRCAAQIAFVSEVRSAGGVFEPFNKKALCPNGGGSKGTLCVEHGKMVLADGLALLSTGNFDRSNLCIDGATKCNRDFSLIVDEPRIYGALKSIFEADLKGQSYDLAALIPPDLKNLLTVSPISLDPILAFIDSAVYSLDIEAQYLTSPALLAAIERAARRGVQVNATLASACAFGRPDNSSRRKITQIYGTFDRLGVSSSFFNASNRVAGLPGYMHAKVIVVDETRAWVGSINGSPQSLMLNREFGLIFDTPEWVQRVLEIVRADHESSDSETWQESLECSKDLNWPPPLVHPSAKLGSS